MKVNHEKIRINIYILLFDIHKIWLILKNGETKLTANSKKRAKYNLNIKNLFLLNYLESKYIKKEHKTNKMNENSSLKWNMINPSQYFLMMKTSYSWISLLTKEKKERMYSTN